MNLFNVGFKCEKKLVQRSVCLHVNILYFFFPLYSDAEFPFNEKVTPDGVNRDSAIIGGKIICETVLKMLNVLPKASWYT